MVTEVLPALHLLWLLDEYNDKECDEPVGSTAQFFSFFPTLWSPLPWSTREMSLLENSMPIGDVRRKSRSGCPFSLGLFDSPRPVQCGDDGTRNFFVLARYVHV